MKIKKTAFTLIEILVSILIVSIVLISGFQAYSIALAGKVRLIEKTKLQKETILFTERFFQTIKLGGTIDYEEYFNRKVVGSETQSGHYSKQTGFGNFGKCEKLSCKPSIGNLPTDKVSEFGNGFYYCRSGDVNKMTSTGGCFDSSKFMSNGSGESIKPGNNQPQRYGQYSFQFIDYNSNLDDDKGDENGDGNIIGDDDDENLGNGPRVFTGGVDVRELYLISGDKKTRTYFRYNVKKDPDAPTAQYCEQNGTGSGCLGTIEFLVLQGKDWGMDHNKGSQNDKTKNDGVIDTWIVDKRFSGKPDDEIAGSFSTDTYWKPLFPDSINVSDFKVFPYPNMEESRAWNLIGTEADKVKFSPYIIISIEIKPSWKIKNKIKGNTKPMRFNTTINLTNIFSK